jgi:hypothetical protein
MLAAVIAMGLIWGHTLCRQHEQFSLAEEARARGDVIAALAGYESAIRMYTPYSPMVERAAAGLWSLGEDSLRNGDGKIAVIAFTSIRCSFHAIRGLTSPGKDWIARCDRKLARISQIETYD